MSKKAQELLANTYAPAVLNRLSRFPAREQLTLAAWLVEHPVGTNHALQILGFLGDLAEREQKSAVIILRDILPEFSADKLKPKEFGRRLRNYLYRLVHPEAESQRLTQFLEFEKSLKLPGDCRLHPPQSPEGKECRLEIIFESPEELQEKIREINTSLRKGFWKGFKNLFSDDVLLKK